MTYSPLNFRKEKIHKFKCMLCFVILTSIRRVLLPFCCVTRYIPANMLGVTSIGDKFAIMIRPGSQKKSGIPIVHERISPFWPPISG